jgi:hypothetical protein
MDFEQKFKIFLSSLAMNKVSHIISAGNVADPGRFIALYQFAIAINLKREIQIRQTAKNNQNS